ncbi:hypothetical protein D9M70_600230 [compost metagenome]
MSPMPWLLPMMSVRIDTIIMRPSVMLRSNRSIGYAMRMSSVASSMRYTSASTPLVKSSVVLTSTLVPVDDSAAKCAAASR